MSKRNGILSGLILLAVASTILPKSVQAQLPVEPCTAAQEVAHIHSVFLNGGGAWVFRHFGKRNEAVIPLSPICPGDVPMANGAAKIIVQTAGGRVVEITRKTPWKEPKITRSPLISNTWAIVVDKLVQDAVRWQSPQVSRNPFAIGVAESVLPGLREGTARVWINDVSGSIIIPIYGVSSLRSVRLQRIETGLMISDSIKMVGDSIVVEGPLAEGKYRLIGQRNRTNSTALPEIDLGGFIVEAGAAPEMPGQLDANSRYGSKTGTGLRSIWMAQSDPLVLSLMAYQLAESATLGSLGEDAVRRAVVHFATQP